MSAPPSDDKSKDKDKASRGSRSRSRHQNRNNGPESVNNKTNNEKTSERRCTCTCHTEKQIQIVFEDDEAYEGKKFHPCVITAALLCPVASNAPIKSWKDFVFVGVAEEINLFTRYLPT